MSEPVSAAPSAPARKAHIVRRLYDWTISWAETRFGTPALGLIAFLESSFFPIPPDVLLIALTFGAPRKWLRYAVVCSVCSVAGAVLGWAIGMGAWHALGDFFFNHVPGFTPEVFHKVESLYQENALIAILGAAFTPIPFKVFTIASGVFEVPVSTLIIGSIIGRSARFFLVAGMIRACGPRVRPFLEKHFEWAALAVFALGVLGFVAIKFVL